MERAESNEDAKRTKEMIDVTQPFQYCSIFQKKLVANVSRIQSHSIINNKQSLKRKNKYYHLGRIRRCSGSFAIGAQFSMTVKQTKGFSTECVKKKLGFGVQRRGASLSSMPSRADEKMGLRLGSMLCVSHRNLLGHQTEPLGTEGRFLIFSLTND